MVRFSDLVGDKGKPEEPSKPTTRPSAPQPSAPPATPRPPSAAPPKAPIAPPITRLSKASPPAAAKPSTTLAPVVEALYAQLILCVRELFTQAREGKPLQLTEADSLTQQLPKLAPGQYDDILILDEQRPEEHYLISHCVHVAFLAHHLSLCLGYTEATAHQLALAGLLIDIGMAGKMEQLVEAPRPLTKEEKRVIEHHPDNAIALLRKSQELSKEALAAIASHHARPDGSGYPKEMLPSTASEYAKILAVADAYDAMTHPRSYRKPMNPAIAMKSLIDGVGDLFERRVVKVMVDELSLYPRGSSVKLNTGELAVVQRVNPGAALRPVVLIYRDADQNAVDPARLLNLSENPLVAIKEVSASADVS